MSVRTDANVIGISDTMITKGTSNPMKVTVNGEQYFVQTRYDKSDGTTSAVVVARTESERTIRTRGRSTRTVTDKVDTPWVLFTTDSEGNTTYGGQGRTDDPDNLIDISPIHTTTAAQAQAILGTAQIDGSAATLDQVVAEHNLRTNQLHDASKRSTRKGAATRTIQGVTPGQATVATAGTVPPVDPDKETELDSDEGKEPENNNKFSEQLGQFAQAVGDNIKKGLALANDNIIITPEELESFLSGMNGGDKIEGGSYPIDNTFGMRNGQDYVTIDQFEYQAPRKDQIFGVVDPEDGNKRKPLKNISEGNLRISPLKKFIAQVKLPMPNSINDSNNVTWGDDKMNNMTAAIVSAAMQNPALVGAAGLGGNLLGGLFGIEGLGQPAALGAVAASATEGGLSERINQIMKIAETPGGQMTAKSQLQSMILGMAGVNVSPESILSRGAGVVPNANMELLFDTPTLRNFEFSWKMTPRDEKEAEVVKKIIRFFKQGMAAKTLNNAAGDRALFLGTPNIFRLQYRTANGEIIEGVNRIKPCAITGTAVNYTPDGVWSAYDQGQPVSTVLTIGMAELEPVYASDYSENVIGSRRSRDITVDKAKDIPQKDGDLYSIRPSEVGY